MIASVFNPELKKFEGKTVAEMAAAMHKPPVDALMDFVMRDNSQTGALYFIASEPRPADRPEAAVDEHRPGRQ